MSTTTDTSTTPVIKRDSAFTRALRSAVSALVGFIVGLAITVWAVPGVPHAVILYTQDHIIDLLLTFGLSTGAVTYIVNLLRKDIPNI
jgi:hypothetical protein